MKKTRSIELTSELAHVPSALPVFLLHPERPLRYGWWARSRDSWDGRRDRGCVSEASGGSEPSTAETPWLRRLRAECHNAIGQERTRTEALVAVLDREIAALKAQIAAAETAGAQREEERRQSDATPVTDAVVGAGEIYSPADERVQRRRLERATTSARLAGQAAAAHEARRTASQQLDVVVQERRNHWIVLQERARVLAEHYQRRASTYIRALERPRRGERFDVPDMGVPDWASADLGAGGRISATAPQPMKLAPVH